MDGIFINYRGEDSYTAAALIDRELVEQFGADRVFLDSRSIPVGADFEVELLGRLHASSVLVVVMGRCWLTLTNEAGERLIDDHRDWVRREIAEALARGMRVVPILLDGAKLPSGDELPHDIASLSRRQYVPLRNRYTTEDLAFLAKRITEAESAAAADRTRKAVRIPRQLPAVPNLPDTRDGANAGRPGEADGDASRASGPGPRINFRAHQLHPSAGGETEDFEQMLALLVQVVKGEDAHLVHARQGDWGIDVLYGDLNGTVEVWQAKYFINGVLESQQQQIRDSFRSAMKAAAAKGHTISRWTLCVPSSMDKKAKKWWDAWRTKEAMAYHVKIELWDETKLRSLLMTPAAEPIRRIYYGYPQTTTPTEPASPACLPPPARLAAVPHVAAAWHTGDEIQLDGASYLVCGEPVEWSSTDGSSIWRTATVARLEGDDLTVRVRQVRTLRRVPAAEQRRAELRTQARLAGPALVKVIDHEGVTAVVTRHPPGRAWRDLFGPADERPDRIVAAAALAAAADVCDELRQLHQAGHSHRCLSPDDIIVPSGPGRARLRDLGLAAITPSIDDRLAAQRTPESARPPYGAGARTDVYQLAALIYHTLTCHPSGPMCPPIRASMPGFPADLDDMVLCCLSSDPVQRPSSIHMLRAALRRGRGQLSGRGV